MNTEDIVTIHSYETPRTSSEFTEWWNDRYRKYGETRAGIVYCREGKGLSKKFHEEAHPMCTFMSVYFSGTAIRCRLLAGNDPEDAVLIDEAGHVFKKIQITFATDGRTERLRSRELTRIGHVDGLGKPMEFGRGRSKTVTFPTAEASRHQDHVDELVTMVRQRIETKSSKAYGAEFELVVGFSDRCLDQEDANSFVKLKAETPHRFSEIYLIGIHGVIVVPDRAAVFLGRNV